MCLLCDRLAMLLSRAWISLGSLLLALPILASEQSDLLQAEGLEALHRGAVEEALAAFDQAVAADPEDVFALYYRAMARGRLQDYYGAIGDLETVLERRPDLDEAAFELGVLLVQNRHYSAAIAPLIQAERVPRFA